MTELNRISLFIAIAAIAIAIVSIVMAFPPSIGETVTSVNTGSGLTGGPITTTGTISVATDGITRSHIVGNTITASEIAPGAIGTSEIANQGITKQKFAAGALQTYNVQASQTQAPETVGPSLVADCDPGDIATGGGGSSVGGALGIRLLQSSPTPPRNDVIPTGWLVTYENSAAFSRDVYVFVICLDLPPLRP